VTVGVLVVQGFSVAQSCAGLNPSVVFISRHARTKIPAHGAHHGSSRKTGAELRSWIKETKMNSKPDRFAISEGVYGINDYEPYAKSSIRFAMCLMVVFAFLVAGAAWFVTAINLPDAAAASGAPCAQAAPEVDYLPSRFEKEQAAAPIVEQAPTF
jgi:hypothetical protein